MSAYCSFLWGASPSLFPVSPGAVSLSLPPYPHSQAWKHDPCLASHITSYPWRQPSSFLCNWNTRKLSAAGGPQLRQHKLGVQVALSPAVKRKSTVVGEKASPQRKAQRPGEVSPNDIDWIHVSRLATANQYPFCLS